MKPFYASKESQKILVLSVFSADDESHYHYMDRGSRKVKVMLAAQLTGWTWEGWAE